MRRQHLFLAIIWLTFLVRGAFYCSYFPLWEGFDEWAHFAYIERMDFAADPLPSRYAPVSAAIARSLELAPVPWELRTLPPPALTEDAYWALPPQARAAREAALRALPLSLSSQPSPSGPQIYEALQPPLSYWLLSLLHHVLRHASLLTRVFALRYCSLLIASFVIPLTFLVAQALRPPDPFALTAPLFLTLLPEFLIDTCRISNEPLAIVLFSALTLFFIRLAAPQPHKLAALGAGLTLGLGLLTKAYFLAAIPALLVLFVWSMRRRATRRVLLDSAITLGVATALGGWFYLRNLLTTGTWSGLNESVMLQHLSTRDFLVGLTRVQWLRGIDSILVPHLWFGGWSSLGLRSWMYHALFVWIAISALGILLALARRTVPATTPLRILLDHPAL